MAQKNCSASNAAIGARLRPVIASSVEREAWHPWELIAGLKVVRSDSSSDFSRSRFLRSVRGTLGRPDDQDLKYSTGEDVRLWDRLEVWSGCRGLVVFSVDDDAYTARFPKGQWAYLGSGVMRTPMSWVPRRGPRYPVLSFGPTAAPPDGVRTVNELIRRMMSSGEEMLSNQGIHLNARL
jgi:hypothetical protein